MTVRRPVTLAFAGDVHFMKLPGARLASNPDTALGPVAAVLRRADVAMVNLETTVTTRGTPQPKHYTFRAPPTAFGALRAAGVDLATMGNNHGMDDGLVGLRDSLAAAAAARFPVVGIGRDATRAYAPWLVRVRGQRVAILGATQVLEPGLRAAWTAGSSNPGLASASDQARLAAAVRGARRAADTVVVYVHWGEEGDPCPTGLQRRLAHLLARAGADVVVGHPCAHPAGQRLARQDLRRLRARQLLLVELVLRAQPDDRRADPHARHPGGAADGLDTSGHPPRRSCPTHGSGRHQGPRAVRRCPRLHRPRCDRPVNSPVPAPQDSAGGSLREVMSRLGHSTTVAGCGRALPARHGRPGRLSPAS